LRQRTKKVSAVPPQALTTASTPEQQTQIVALKARYTPVNEEATKLRVQLDAFEARLDELNEDECWQFCYLSRTYRSLCYKLQHLGIQANKLNAQIKRVPMTIAESTVEQLQTAIERIEILDYLAQFGVTEETLLRRTESVNEYAQRTGVPSRTVRKGCAKGLIHAVKHFGEWRIMPAAHLLQGEWEPQQVAA
jgi:hypothetical protein